VPNRAHVHVRLLALKLALGHLLVPSKNEVIFKVGVTGADEQR